MKKFIKKIFFRIMLSLFRKLGTILRKNQLKTVSKIIGNIFFIIPWKRKYTTFENLKVAFGEKLSEKQLKENQKKFFCEIILMILEISHNVVHRETIIPWVEASGLEHLDSALKKGRGVIALSGHLGNVPVMTAWLAEKGYPVAVLFKEGKYLPKGFLYNLIKSYNIYPIPFHSDRDVPKEIIKALNRGMIVFILADQARPGVYARFFGKYVQCQKGPFVIARRKDSPIVPIFIVKENDKYRLMVYPELSIENNGLNKSLSDKEIVDLVEKYNILLENLIRQYPEQYYWFHRRFKKMKTH